MANGRKQDWRNRIVEYADVPPDQLLANPANFRRHPKEQSAALSGVIDEVGYLDPVLVQAGTDVVLDGHLRVELAMRENQATIPVKYVDLTDAEADLVLATFDPLTAMAYHDAEQLRELLDAVSTSDAAVMAMLSSLAEQEGIIPPDTFDPNAEWQGMPEFHQENQEAVKQIIVNFASESDVEQFARLVEQNVRMTTKSIWYPYVPIESAVDKAYVPVGDADAA